MVSVKNVKMHLIFTSPPDALQFFGKVTYSCLLNGGKDFNRGRERDIFLRLPPGQVFDLDDQCKMAFGPTSLHIGVNYSLYFYIYLKLNYIVLIRY